jgi:hypothetical protein
MDESRLLDSHPAGASERQWMNAGCWILIQQEQVNGNG